MSLSVVSVTIVIKQILNYIYSIFIFSIVQYLSVMAVLIWYLLSLTA